MTRIPNYFEGAPARFENNGLQITGAIIGKTGDPNDSETYVSCGQVFNDTVRLPSYSRIASIQYTGESRFYGNPPEDSMGGISITGTAYVGDKSTNLNRTYSFIGTDPSPLDFVGTIERSPLEYNQSVCGFDFRLEINSLNMFIKAGFDSTARMAGGLIIHFEPTTEFDPRCTNRPNVALTPDIIHDNNVVRNGQLLEIVGVNAEKCLDVRESAMWANAPLHQWECLNPKNQRFRVIDHGDSVSLQAEHSNKCVTIGGGGDTNGAPVTQTDDCYSPAAKVKIVRGNHLANSYTLRSARNGKCLDVPNGQRDNGALLQQWDCVGTKWQEWWINVK